MVLDSASHPRTLHFILDPHLYIPAARYDIFACTSHAPASTLRVDPADCMLSVRPSFNIPCHTLSSCCALVSVTHSV